MQLDASSSSSSHLKRAAQYLRMSTEHQQYSIANQSASIALYAAAHNVGIVRSFTDEGKSGTTINGRKGLQELLQAVQSGSADFDLILVYDVSRWGRFADADEAAHYEYLCKKAGVEVEYCAEQFENDNSATSNLLKALKRTMAGEYSRELSVKISAGQRRLAGMGWWQGGSAPFGMRRQIVDEHGKRKQILKHGEWKSVSTDRVVLVPGAKKEVETVRLAFDLYTKKRKTRQEIAELLNQRKCFKGKRPWNADRLRYFLSNPVYKGAYAYSKTHLAKQFPAEKWLILEHRFPALVSDQQWNRARDLIREELRPLVDSGMLDGLRRLWKRKGTISSDLINEAKDLPSAVAYQSHFGGLLEAYRQIGFPVTRDSPSLRAIGANRKMRDDLCEEICNQIRAHDGIVERTSCRRVLQINHNITAEVVFCTGQQKRSGEVRWVLSLGRRFKRDILIIACLNPADRQILHYFVVPALSQLRGTVSSKRDFNPPFLEPYCFSTLEEAVKTFRHIRITA